MDTNVLRNLDEEIMLPVQQETPAGNVTDSDNKATGSKPEPHLSRVIWRWHFYAGLIVTPVLIVVALTGAVMLLIVLGNGVLTR